MENQNTIYIEKSKENINQALYMGDFKKAYGLTILVLERLSEKDKAEFVKYYSKRLENIMAGVDSINPWKPDYFL
jgi:hypothetical protein